MSLYETWIKAAYDNKGVSDKKFWAKYMPLEQKIYEDILEGKITKLTGRVGEFARKYSMKPEYIYGFLDGIKDAATVNSETEKLVIENLTEETEFEIIIDFEKLFKKMVEYKAKHLYTLPQWLNIYTQEEMDKMEIDQKKSGTYVRDEKVGRNDPCPCGSGKKYKKCCGAASA